MRRPAKDPVESFLSWSFCVSKKLHLCDEQSVNEEKVNFTSGDTSLPMQWTS